MIPRDPFDLAEAMGDYGAIGCAPPSDRAGRASPLNRLRRFRGVPSTGAKETNKATGEAVACFGHPPKAGRSPEAPANIRLAAQVLLGIAALYLVIFFVGAVG